MTQLASSLLPEFRARYDAFIASLSIEEVRFSNVEIDAPHRYSQTYSGLEADISTASGFTNGEASFAAWTTVVFEGRRPQEEQPKVRVRVTVEVTYHAVELMTDDIFEVFSQRNLPLNTWPYLREYVQSALARAGWPVYTLPAFKPAALQLKLDLDSPQES